MDKNFFKKLKDVFFPRDYTCDICGAETFGNNICADCLKTLTFNDGATCPVCGRKTTKEEICIECKAQLPRFKKAVSALVYDGGATILVHKFKNGYAYLKEYFADLVTKKLSGFPQVDCIAGVPMTKKSVRRRGYNQTELLAKSISKRTQITFLKGAMEKARETVKQKSLTRKEREENLNGAFKVKRREEIAGKSVLVVDDVLTTGATADEICKTLLAAGAKEVYLATVASVEYKIMPEEIIT